MVRPNLSGFIPFFAALAGMMGATLAARAQAPKPADAHASAGPAAEASAKDAPAPPEIEKSTVRIFVTKRGPNVFRPWMKEPPVEETASGIVIEGKRILTTAVSVQYSNDIQVQANQAGDKVAAEVEFSDTDMDLAVLKLEDESFFDSHPPVPRADGLPLLKDPLFVYGFPVGGISLSVTKGIISRIEYGSGGGFPYYNFRIQIDAALNAGNAGGPAVSNGKMVGVALGSLNNAQNIGYVIPNEEVEIFLREAASGKVAEKPSFYDYYHRIENAGFRRFLGLPKDESGVAIQSIASSDPSYPLRQWDVIEKVGSYEVDDQGMVRVGELRLRFPYAVRKEAKDGKVPMEIFRKGGHLHVDVPLTKREMLVPGVRGAYPPYFIFGPIVFTKGTQALVTDITDNSRFRATLTFDGSPMEYRRGDTAAFPGEELVIVPCPFFPNSLAIGYSEPFPRVVDTINGIKVRNLRQVVEILRDAKTEFISITFAERNREDLFFPREETVAATEGILADNGVRAQASPDLLEVWKSKTAP